MNKAPRDSAVSGLLGKRGKQKCVEARIALLMAVGTWGAAYLLDSLC